jgi:NADH:ubiquinone oxidoreductase subunit 3 (subunit A)
MLPYLNSYGFWVVEIFMILITIGFIFEYAVNALDWETI